jgi:hypothetical protein
MELVEVLTIPYRKNVSCYEMYMQKGHVARMGERIGVYRVLVGKPEGKTPLGRPRRGWEDNIKMDLQEVECGGMDWIVLAQDRDQKAGTCECSNEPSGSMKCGEFL